MTLSNRFEKTKYLTLITSIIKPPKTALSYWHTRSIYSDETRLEQVKNTIETVREKIPRNKIILVECSPLSPEETLYFETNTDYFINLYDDIEERCNIYSPSKALGEGTMTKAAFKYVFENNILYDYFFKITGRYWLNINFDINKIENIQTPIPRSVVKYINQDPTNGCTSLYHLTNIHSILWYDYLINSTDKMIDCKNYEHIFIDFLRTLPSNEFYPIDKIGISGTWAPTGDIVDE
jgi:hypothetical protein